MAGCKRRLPSSHVTEEQDSSTIELRLYIDGLVHGALSRGWSLSRIVSEVIEAYECDRKQLQQQKLASTEKTPLLLGGRLGNSSEVKAGFMENIHVGAFADHLRQKQCSAHVTAMEEPTDANNSSKESSWFYSAPKLCANGELSDDKITLKREPSKQVYSCLSAVKPPDINAGGGSRLNQSQDVQAQVPVPHEFKSEFYPKRACRTNAEDNCDQFPEARLENFSPFSGSDCSSTTCSLPQMPSTGQQHLFWEDCETTMDIYAMKKVRLPAVDTSPSHATPPDRASCVTFLPQHGLGVNATNSNALDESASTWLMENQALSHFKLTRN